MQTPLVDLCQHCIQEFGCLTLHCRHDMAVRVHRQADLRVPKRLHDHAGRNMLGEHQRRAAVAQVMEPLTR